MTVTGEQFGHYRLIRLLGKGGMGEVYLARDLTLDRDVAIKLLPLAKADDHEARRRLLREAQAVAKLDHPNICQVFEVDEAPDGRAFIAMSYVDGDTLATRLARGPMPVRDALMLARDIAEALGAAHALGIVHRDLKPHNVMITASGRPKLLDFGIAKLRAGSAAAADAPTDSGDTAPGAIVGTPAYMSPEQVAGGFLDGRSDLFALGAVLFECLTGRRAFEGTSTGSILGAIAHVHPPPVSALRPDAPAGVDELCARLLEKDPTDRLQTADEVVGALRMLLPGTHHGTAPMPPAVRRRRPHYYALAAVLVVFAGLAGTRVYQTWRQLPEPPAEAERWYRRGIEFLREGAYHSAASALDQAITQFPSYAFAYARKAEALAELDDQTRASEQLLRMQQVLGDESRLSTVERYRLRAIRALVLRDLPRAVEAYRALVDRTPADAGAWVDLGRAQEAAEQRVDAMASHTRALALDRAMPAAHVRVASLHAQAGRREPALAAFAEAERLYRAASNVEGETEVLIRRGVFLDARDEIGPARADLERARSLAADSGAAAQFVRARLALGSLLVTEGKLTAAERLIHEATEDARKGELWTLVADGMIEMGALLVNQSSRAEEADALVQEAVRLATQRGAQRTAARATLQRAALALQREQPALARDLAGSTLDFLKTQGHRRLELTALTIIGRAQRDLDDLTGAQTSALAVLSAARDLGDEAQVAQALTSLAGAKTSAGDLPGALQARDEAEVLNRKSGNEAALPFSLTNRAELLIRLGRRAEADRLLMKVDEGIAGGREAYKSRAQRVAYLRALSAVIAGDGAHAARFARQVMRGASPTDAEAVLARAMLGYALAGAPGDPGPVPDAVQLPARPDDERELHYWLALDARRRRDERQAQAHAAAGLALAQRVSNDELTWRLAAVGALAAGALGDTAASDRLRSVVAASRARLQERWQGAVESYDARADLRALRKAVERP